MWDIFDEKLWQHNQNQALFLCVKTYLFGVFFTGKFKFNATVAFLSRYLRYRSVFKPIFDATRSIFFCKLLPWAASS